MTGRDVLLLAPLRAGILTGSPARSARDAAASAAGSSHRHSAEGCPRGTATEEGTLPDRPDRTLEELADGIRDGSLAGLPLAKRLTMALADVLLVVRRDMEALAADARENGEQVAHRHYMDAAIKGHSARIATRRVESYLDALEASFERASRDQAPLVIGVDSHVGGIAAVIVDPGYPDAA